MEATGQNKEYSSTNRTGYEVENTTSISREGFFGALNEMKSLANDAPDYHLTANNCHEAADHVADIATGGTGSTNFTDYQAPSIEETLQSAIPEEYKQYINLDPIVIDLDGDGVELVGLDKSSAFVDVDKDDYQENTGWAHQDDGILAIDLDGSGDVNDAAEFQFAGETNTDDTDMEAFRALYDSNDDGVFDANDSDWHKAGIWRDLNQNGRIAEYV